MSDKILNELLSADEFAMQQLLEVRGKMGSREYWENWQSEEMLGVEALLGALVLRSSDEVKILAIATAKEYAMRKVLMMGKFARKASG